MVTSLTAGDSLLLYTETEFQHQHMIGVLVLDPSTAPHGFDVDTLMKVSETMVDDAPAYRLKLVDSPLALDVPMLAEDPEFNLRNHVSHIAVPAPGSMEQLAEIVSDFASRPLPRSRPMWENLIVSGLEGGLIAMVSKTHHCLQDGVGGAEVMAKMFDLEADPPPRPQDNKPSVRTRTTEPSPLEILREAYRANRERPSVFNTANKAVRTLLKRREANKNVPQPELLAPDMRTAPRLFFNGQLSPFRNMAMGSLSLGEVKQLKKAYGVTLNDTILALVTLGLRKYLAQHDDMPDADIACAIPVSLALNKSDDKEEVEGNNQVDMMNVRLPMAIDDAAELIQTIHLCSNAAKDLFAQSGDTITRQVVATLPPRLASTGLGLMSGSMMAKNPMANLGVSNIPGPPFPLFMKGAQVVANYPMGPVPNGVGLGITMMSYIDRIDFTVQGCRDLMPDAQQLVSYIESAAADLLAAMPEPEESGEPAPKAKAKAKRQPKAKARTKSQAKTKAKPKKKA